MATQQLSARQYDQYNMYFCPTQDQGDCERHMCLREKKQPPGFVGPSASHYECYDPDTGSTAPPFVWNPVYNAIQPIPAGMVPASECPEPSKHDMSKAYKVWLWIIVIIVIVFIIWMAGAYWAHHHHQPSHTMRSDSQAPKQRQRQSSSRSDGSQTPAGTMWNSSYQD
jgi:hypothetical protein